MLVEVNTLLDPLSCIFELGTPKYIIIPSMVFGCSDDMLELCPVLCQTRVGDLCILHGQPEIGEASDLRPDFRKNVFSYPPPPPQPQHIGKALFLEISKRYNIPYTTTFFRKSARTKKFLLV